MWVQTDHGMKEVSSPPIIAEELNDILEIQELRQVGKWAKMACMIVRISRDLKKGYFTLIQWKQQCNITGISQGLYFSSHIISLHNMLDEKANENIIDNGLKKFLGCF